MSEARELADEALALARRAGDPGWIAACLLAVVSAADWDQARIETIDEGLERARRAGDQWREGWIRTHLALQWRTEGLDQEDEELVRRAEALFEQNLRLFREIGDERGIGFTLGHLAVIVFRWDRDLDRARRLGRESLAIGRRLGVFGVIENALGFLACTAYLGGDFDTARMLWREEADLTEQTLGREDPDAHGFLGRVAYAQGDYATARDHLRWSLSMHLEAPFPWELRTLQCAVWTLGRVLARQGDPLRAVVLFAAVDSAAHEVGPPWYRDSHESVDHEECLSVIEEALTPAEFEEAWAQGSAMTLEQAAGFALEVLSESSDGSVSAV